MKYQKEGEKKSNYFLPSLVVIQLHWDYSTKEYDFNTCICMVYTSISSSIKTSRQNKQINQLT